LRIFPITLLPNNLITKKCWIILIKILKLSSI
jgi:hypothetical protein